LAFAAQGSGVAAAPPIDLDTKVLFFFFGYVAIGTVKWFNPTKGYGFIAPDGGGNDVFVHISAVEKAGYTSLAEGAKVSYELMTNRSGKTGGRQSASGVSGCESVYAILAARIVPYRVPSAILAALEDRTPRLVPQAFQLSPKARMPCGQFPFELVSLAIIGPSNM
jgi:CspA family cold shock protein